MTERIIITGGTGTLGHAIVMTAERESWNCEFTIYARSELRLSRMKQKFPHITTIIGDVRDYNRLSAAIVGHDTCIHAAALKRIPECEKHPGECYLTNVVGSDNVARACYGKISKVIGISTDKACRAITCYGASKLMMESVFLSYHNERNGTLYSVVRYGNVVASNGSVIPLWEEQYKSGLPLTITDKMMSRFWMSPFDAVTAIKRSLNKPGVIFVPKILSCPMTDVANHLFPGCQFEEIGFRSKEKVHEDLVAADELSIEYNDHFIVGSGSTGKEYKSSNANRLPMNIFDKMLLDSKEVE